jgi:hypothetical protein
LPSTYHLADGVILSIGTLDTCLVDLERDYEVRIDYRYVPPLEKTCLGWTLEGFEAFVPRLLSEKILAEGEPGADPVIKSRLQKLDRMFLRDYEATLSPRARAAYDALLDAHSRRKRFFERVGQCPILPETALRRALLVGDANDVGKKKVLCLGDDDLVSVGLALLGHEVTVYDIDEYLMTFLRGYAGARGLSIDVVERDLRDPLGEGESERFDAFLTDPMSNRDCFEIFLSRAFALTKPGGVGFTACYPPVVRLLRSIAGEMRFDVGRHFARFNRYYSKYMKMHDYGSDWVEVKKRPDTRLPHAPDQFSVPLNLYREDYYQRPKSLVSFLEQIEEPRFATPLFLDIVLDVLEAQGGKLFGDRIVHMEDDWTVIHCPMDKGYLTLHVDRARRQLMVDMYPFNPSLELALRELLLSAYKTRASASTVTVNRAVWDVRVR